MGDLRPTLFLAQLSNLLAGNISIVHGVTGASRTFMGEESSGVDAIRIAREPHRLRPGRHLPRRRRLQRRASRRAPDLRDGRLPLEEALPAGLGAPGGRRRHDPRHRAPASWCSNRASMPPRAARSRSRPSRASPPTAPAARPAASRQRSMPCRSSSAPSPTWCCPARPASRASRTRSRRLSRTSRRRPPCMPPAISSATRWRRRPPTGVALAAALIAEGKAGEALVTSVGHWRGEGAIRLTKA